jgi:hypothetical protein
MSKPIVRYNHLVGWHKALKGGVQALLKGIEGHPSLGTYEGDIYTSRVLRIDYDADGYVVRLETLNTVYEPKVAP